MKRETGNYQILGQLITFIPDSLPPKIHHLILAMI